MVEIMANQYGSVFSKPSKDISLLDLSELKVPEDRTLFVRDVNVVVYDS